MEDLEFGALADAANQEAKRAPEANRQEALQRKTASMERKRQKADDTEMCTVIVAWSLVQLEAEQPENDAWMHHGWMDFRSSQR
ncbi:hypothetical protein BV898_05269 [Hypsibius exemplaris]|uniref:Uncharacterized protein n=1 Tax=Hypsibius exemplaris TaxID=2072580 RepID=A0A1W0WZT3_HYPEX|nr:hypothetical protein BV898_05269 [Hypsibius exemplaris]